MATRQLVVHLDGQPIGLVEQSTGGALAFTYDEQYRRNSSATPLSLSMPLSRSSFGQRIVWAFLWGLLPDSPEARERLGRTHGVSPNNPFSLLTHVGRDAAGAVQILTPGLESDDADSQGDIEWLTEDDFSTVVRSLAEHARTWDPGRLAAQGRWSLAGAQPKVALFRDEQTGRWGLPRDSTPTTHIVKPMLDHLAEHHVNEYLCLSAAARAGLPAARVELIDSGDVRALVSVRYDRAVVDGRWHRLHQEDLCQSLSVHPSMKYQADGGPGVGEIADLLMRLRAPDRAASSKRFVEALAFNVLIGGTDAHAKNYSMLLRGPRAQLAPLYDIASAAVYPQHRRLVSPMRIGKHHRFLDVGRADWEAVGRRLGLNGEETVDRVERLRAALPTAFETEAVGLPHELRAIADPMVERILAHADGSWRPDLDRDPALVLPTPAAVLRAPS